MQDVVHCKLFAQRRGLRRLLMSWAGKLAKPYRVEDGKEFRLKDFDPGDTGKLHSKEHARELLEKGIALMSELQDKLYAQDRWALLLIFQAMDAEKMRSKAQRSWA